MCFYTRFTLFLVVFEWSHSALETVREYMPNNGVNKCKNLDTC